ncbi:hypothetical protein GALL_419760 [mine drainage metagenome]|uniref:Uncharacterized protein n=1 Tax=mine drainage metagenome TaxID=410659 RepID=A0A1J5PXZ0_9ZZZZ
MLEDVAPEPPHPFAGLARVQVSGVGDRVLETVDVVRVHQDRAGELVRGAGELAQHQRAALVRPGGDVLLGDQVHAVAQRRDEHDVGREVERGHLLGRVGVVHVVDGRLPEPPELAVDAPDQQLDVLTELLVRADVLPARARHLDERDPGHRETAVPEQLAERLDPVADALGVVEPVDAEQQHVRVAELAADLPGALLHARRPRERVELLRVDRDRKGGGPDVPGRRAGCDTVAVRWLRVGDGVVLGDRDHLAPGGQVGEASDGPDEVLGATGALEPDQVGAEQTVDDLAPPRHLAEDLDGRERDVQEEPDPQVRASRPQHRRHELELVVVDPDDGALGGVRRGRVGEGLVDPAVRVPPLPVEGRRCDHVVVERPQGVVREALVVLLDLDGGQGDRDQSHAVRVERLELDVRRARPSDPRAGRLLHDGLEGRDQASR